MSGEVLANNANLNVVVKREKDYAISVIRLIATIFLITCHVMQYFDMELRKWFNVCVQMFLCTSGFLYGQRTIKSKKDFYKKSASKILVDYYIVFFAVLILQIFTIPDFIKKGEVINGIFVSTEGGPLVGGGHLWFVSYILFLYFITPLFQALFNNAYEKKGEIGIIFTLVLTGAVCAILTRFYIPYFVSAWINCYIIGYVLGFMKSKKCKHLKTVVIAIFVIAFAMNGLRIYFDYIIHKSFVGGRFEALYTTFYNYSHAMLGVMLCCLIYVIFSKLFSGGGIITRKKSFRFFRYDFL